MKLGKYVYQVSVNRGTSMSAWFFLSRKDAISFLKKKRAKSKKMFRIPVTEKSRGWIEKYFN